MEQEDNRFTAYEIHHYPDMPLTVAPLQREWMDASHERAAYRCLPLNIANQAGWVIANPVDFVAIWDGGLFLQSVQIDFNPSPAAAEGGLPYEVITVGAADRHASRPPDPRVTSHFGSGVITFSLPYLFRTPEGVNLWVKGPSNWIKDGVQPLEGIVETDWLSATFTMNWKLTRPGYPVRFQRGEPICMVVPVARSLAESLDPVCLPLQTRPDLERQYQEWMRSRAEFNRALHNRHPDAVRAGWQRDYVKGVMPDGTVAGEHQNRLELKEFQRLSDEARRAP